MKVTNETYPEEAVWVCDVLFGVAKMGWIVMSGVTKTAWDVLSGVTKTAWDVLSGVANLCGMFCPGCKKWHGIPGCFVRLPGQKPTRTKAHLYAFNRDRFELMDKLRDGGGGTLIFSSYLGSSTASTVHPQKYQEFQAPQINIWNFCNPKDILYPVPWPSEKTLKCIEITSKYSPILWWPQKNIHKIFIPPPPKYSVFWKKNKNIEILSFEPQKIAWAYVCMKTSECHTHWWTNGQADLRWRVSLLLKSEISSISFCLAPLIKVHANCYYQIKGHLA